MIRFSDRTWWTQLAVGLSVTLNVFFVAFLAAQAWLGAFRPAPEAAVAPREILRQLGEKLPPADAEHLRRAFADRLPELVKIRREARAAGEKVRADIGATPFDVDSLRADLAAARVTREKVRPLIEQALLEALPQMSDEGRMILSHYRLARRQAAR